MTGCVGELPNSHSQYSGTGRIYARSARACRHFRSGVFRATARFVAALWARAALLAESPLFPQSLRLIVKLLAADRSLVHQAAFSHGEDGNAVGVLGVCACAGFER